MALGIDFALNTPLVQNRTINGFEVTDVTLDFIGNELVIAYDMKDDNDNFMDEQKVVTVDGQAAVNMFARAQNLATNNSETVIRALYYVCTEEVRDSLGVSGTINVA